MMTKISRRMAAILAAGAIVLATALPAGAWHYWNDATTPHYWPSGNVGYCISNAPTTTHRNSVIAMADRLNGYLGNITLVNSSWPNCPISITFGNFTDFDSIARTGHAPFNGVYLTDADIQINTRYSMWQYGAVQDCYVGVAGGCLPDMRTIVMHEFGHAIGLGHNRGTENATRCVELYYSTQSLAACDYYGEAVMAWSAGIEFMNRGITGGFQHQGYRHDWPSQDDVLGLNSLY